MEESIKKKEIVTKMSPRIYFFRENINVFSDFRKNTYICTHNGGLAQLARALAWHARGHEFESRILHPRSKISWFFLREF